MKNVSLIVAMDEGRGIGKDQQLLCHLPADLAFFKAQTMGKPMIMGRKTFDSIGKALPGRRSIVLTSQKLTIPGVEIAHSPEQALAICKESAEIMVIGGSSLYELFLPIAHRMYVTLIHHNFLADTFFPKFAQNEWQITSIKEFAADAKNAYDLTFACYERLR